MTLTTRLRRLRSHNKIRDLIRETSLTTNDLIMPLFICPGRNIKNPIASMPGQYQMSIDVLLEEIKTIEDLNIPGILLFGIPETKDATGTQSYQENGIVQQAIRSIKEQTPELLVIADACFCEYTDHGHCGVVIEHHGCYQIDNDETLSLLVKQVISLAEAGADMIAPSGMMDGMVAALRDGLDEHGFSHLPILSYAAKYCSSFYGPFREAAEGAPQFGDRTSYQMDSANANEALRETQLDVLEGVDILMVKPAHTYLDVIYRVKQQHPDVPLAAYHVSGEYTMLKAASANGWLDEKKVVMEVLFSIKRAGADFIISYFAKEVAGWLNNN